MPSEGEESSSSPEYGYDKYEQPPPLALSQMHNVSGSYEAQQYADEPSDTDISMFPSVTAGIDMFPL